MSEPWSAEETKAWRFWLDRGLLPDVSPQSAVDRMRAVLDALAAAREREQDHEGTLASLADSINMGLRDVGRAGCQVTTWTLAALREGVDQIVFAHTAMQRERDEAHEREQRAVAALIRIASMESEVPGLVPYLYGHAARIAWLALDEDARSRVERTCAECHRIDDRYLLPPDEAPR